MASILENDLIKDTFKIAEKGHTNLTSSLNEDIPTDILDNIASDTITMSGLDEDDHDNVEEDDDDPEAQDELQEDSSDVLYCTACTDPKLCLSGKHKIYKGNFNVKDPEYSKNKGGKLDRWFKNLKTSLNRHLL